MGSLDSSSLSGSFSVAFAIILVFKVDRLGICVVLFLTAATAGASSTFGSGAGSSFLGVSVLALGAGAFGGAVTTFFFQHLIRAVRG